MRLTSDLKDRTGRIQIILIAVFCFQASLLFVEDAFSQSQGSQAPVESADAELLSTRSVPVQRVIAHGSQFYQVNLVSGQFLRVVVDQRGVDLKVRLFDSKGAKRAEIDSTNGAWGPEHLLFVADETGIYRVEVRLLESYLPAGRYRISIVEQRIATEQDRTRVSAQQHYSKGNELLDVGTKESLTWARAEYEEALRLQKGSMDSRGEASTLVQLGTLALYTGEQAKGLDYFTQALPLWRAVNDRGGEAVTLNNLGFAYNRFGSKQKALDYFTQAGRIFRLLGDVREVADISNNMATAYVRLGEYERAFSYLNEALPYFQSHKDPVAANILTNLAVVYESRGEYQKAIESVSQALIILRQAKKRREEGNALLTGGTIYEVLGKHEQARGQFSDGLQIFESLGDQQGQARALAYRGKTYVLSGDRQKALKDFTKSLELARAIKDKSVQAYTLNKIGFVQAGLGDQQKALEYYSQALQLMREQRDPHGEAQTLNYIGQAYTQLTNKEQAFDNFNQALIVNRRIKEKADEGDTLGNLMSAWKAFQNPRLAIFYGKQAINIFQEIRTNVQQLDKESQASFLKSKESVYRETADLLISEGRLSEGQQVLRLLKQQEYFDFLRGGRKETDAIAGGADLTSKEAEWERRYREISDKLITLAKERGDLEEKKSRTPGEEKRLSELDEDLSISREAFRRFLNEISNEFGKSELAKRREFELRESEGLQQDLRELGKGVVALYTLVGEHKYRVILITPDIQRGYEYPISAADLNRKVAAFRQALEDPDTDPLPAAQELYRIVVGPLAKDLNELQPTTLMWSLDGVLRYVPIAALHDGQKYLVERYRNVIFTPASMTRLKDISRTRWRGLGFGVSKALSGFAALPAVPEELHSIIREPGTGDSRGVLPGKIMLDDSFTERIMRSQLRQGYPLVHLASHFQFSPGDKSGSFLLLGDGKHLSIGQIENSANLFSGVDLLTLSACHTAMGGVSDGKEVDGFGELGQRKGAKAVIASLWSVADKSTQLLMLEFYRQRETHPGMSKAQALNKAQLFLLRGRDDQASTKINKAPRGFGLSKEARVLTNDERAGQYSHPFYWAPFILIGNWR